MLNKKLLFIFAICPMPLFTPSEQIKIESPTVLVVTHPTSKYDGRFITKTGIDQAVKRASEAKTPVITLWEPDPKLNSYYFPEQCVTDYTVSSIEGEHSLSHLPNHVISVGGRLDACQLRTMRDVFRDWGKNRKGEDLKFTIIANATYVYGERIFPDDIEFSTWRREIDLVTETKETDVDENGENPRRILSLTEMLEIMAKAEDELEWGRASHLKKLAFISNHIADISPFGPEYRIEYRFLNKRKTYRESNIKDPKIKKPTVTIEVVEDAAHAF